MATNTAEVRIAGLREALARGGEAAIVDRIHPRFATHAQATLRWSITEPPLAQLPVDLWEIIGPDEGWPWFMYDWNGLHLWLTAAYAGDKALMATLQSGADVHSANARDLFGVTHVEKDDIKRLVAKRFIYRVLKGGDFTKPPDTIPLSVFGGKASNFVMAAKRWAYAHAAVIAWQNKVKEAVVRTGEVRTHSGKRRRMSDRSPHSQRAGIDYKCQATEAELLNETILLTVKELGDMVRFKFHRHDFICWAVREVGYNDGVTLKRIAEIAQRAVTINGETWNLEATFHVRPTMELAKVAWKP